MVIDTGTGAGLDPLLQAIAAAIGTSPRDIVGLPVALALRHELTDTSVFVSGVPGDLLALVADAFDAAVDDSGPSIETAEQRWSQQGDTLVGTGPVRADDGVLAGASLVGQRTMHLGAAGRRPTTRLDEAVALRNRLRATSLRLAEDLETPLDFKQIAEIPHPHADAVRAVLADVATSRDHVGRYLLDAGDYFDDERIDQLGDGYVRVAALWSAFAGSPDADLGPAILALEAECANWMGRAAEPPTRYAF
jgi:hypothetical protein